MFILIDNSADFGQILIWNGKEIIKENFADNDSGDLLLSVDKILKKYHLKINTLQGVAVLMGKGRFTSTRVAVTLANTLAYALGVPVLGVQSIDDDWVNKLSVQSTGIYLSAKYSAEPNIGKTNK